MILADHGADVIKVEPPQGDETRDWGPPFDAENHEAAYYLGVNRNKRGIALDLAKPAGRDVVMRLLEGADVLVENFKTGSMEKWGLGYDVLEQRFPGLIHCRVSGFGADGPLGGLPGYDAIVQAMVGLMSINGTADTGPVRMGTPVVDLATGLFSTIGILMALQERARSGRGQYLDMTLHDCGMALLHPSAANFLLNGKRPAGVGNSHTNIAPYETYPTATCDIFLAIGNDGQFRKLSPGRSAGRTCPPIRALPATMPSGCHQPPGTDRGAVQGLCRRGWAGTQRPPVQAGPADRPGAERGRGFGRVAHRRPQDGDGHGWLPRAGHADQAEPHAGQHPHSAHRISASTGLEVLAEHGFERKVRSTALLADGVLFTERRK